VRRFQFALAIGAIAYLIAIVVAGAGCWPMYVLRPDNLVGFGLIGLAAGALFWASAGEALERRLTGMAGSGLLIGLLLWPGSSLLFVPFALAGCLRVPRSPLAVAAGLGLAVAGFVVARGLPELVQGVMTVDQFRCP
jgi:hypothetical protein